MDTERGIQELGQDRWDALIRLTPNHLKLESDQRALVEEMAKKYKIPLNKPTEFTDALKTAALPIAGQIIGGSIGMMGGPATGVLGEMAGGVAGTKANEMFGISKPDEFDYAMSAGVPPAALGLTRGLKHLWPGGAAASQQLGIEKLKAMEGMLGGSKQAVNEAYAQVGNMPLPAKNFATTVESLLTTESTLKKYGVHSPAIVKSLKATADEIAASPQGIPMSEVNGLLKRYREKVAGLETKGGEQYGAYKALRKSLFDDMDAAVASGKGQDALLLRQAMGEAKKNIAKDEFVDLLTQHGTRTETVLGQTFEVIQPTKLLNKLRDMDFERSVGKEQYSKITQTLKELAKIEKPSEAFKTGIGSQGRAIAMGSAGLIGAGAAATVGPGTGAMGVLGGGMGTAMAAYAGVKIHDAAARLMMSDTGRAFLVKLFKHNEGRISQNTAQILQFAASQFQDTGKENPQRQAMSNALVGMATQQDPDEQRRLRMGIPRGLEPQVEEP